jgi:2,5-dihydroxypyridine 5,6-dioxygenase
MSPIPDAACLRGAKVLLADHFCVRRGEHVTLTTDECTDPALIRILCDTAFALGAIPVVLGFSRLPFQGALADPFIPDPVAAAVCESDVWLDMCFPYMAGSTPFDKALERKRTRYLLLGDLDTASFGRLYGCLDFDKLFALQSAADQLFAGAEGKTAHITSPGGSDFRFTIGKPATVKHRRADQPGAQTIPGSAIFYPELESVQGRIVMEAVFHEYYSVPREPLVIEVDGKVRSVSGDGDAIVMDRALRRAGGGEYGNVIHLTVGLNAAARMTGRSFIEDIRSVGCNAIGLGLPWWLPGGGENHPDGVVRQQSLWIEDELIIDKGLPAAGHVLASLLREASPSLSGQA